MQFPFVTSTISFLSSSSYRDCHLVFTRYYQMQTHYNYENTKHSKLNQYLKETSHHMYTCQLVNHIIKIICPL